MRLVKGLGGKTHVDERRLRLLETLSLGGQKKLALIVVGDQQFLVGMGNDSVDSIAVVPEVNAAGFDMVRKPRWEAGF